MPTNKVSEDLKGEYERCSFKRAQSYLVLVKVAAILLVNLLHSVFLLMILCFSLCCTAPSCTILYRPALSCTILHHPAPCCTFCSMLYHPVPSCTFCSMLYHPVPYYTTLYDIVPDSIQCMCLNIGLCGVIAGWIWLGAGPCSGFLQGAFPQSDIKFYLKTRETS